MGTTKQNTITLQMLEVFAAVSETLSLSKAADKLGISQSAVSQSIDRFEAFLGETVLCRNERPLRLTVAGHRILALSAPLLEEKARFLKTFEEINDGGGCVRVAISEIASAVFSEVLDAYLMEHFHSVTVLSNFIPRTKALFKNREVDLAIVPDLDSEEFVIARAAYTEHYLIVTPRTGLFTENRLPLAYLRDHLGERFISYPAASSDRRRSQAILRALSMNAAVHFELESTRAVAHAVACGAGWTILAPTTLFLLGERIENVTVHPIPTAIEKKTLWVAAHDGSFKKSVDTITRLIRHKLQETLLPWLEKKNSCACEAITLKA